MKKKDKVDAECICDQCPRRFICFTQKKVFSDPAYQAMFEAFVEEGIPHEEAVKAVREFIENQKVRENRPLPPPQPDPYDGNKYRWDKWEVPKKEKWGVFPKYTPFKTVYKDLDKMEVGDAKEAVKEIKNDVRTWMRTARASEEMCKRLDKLNGS